MKKRSFIIGCISGTLGGAIAGFYSGTAYNVNSIGIFAFASFISPTDTSRAKN
ncbi:hypothetical protein [Photorhabdus luminescens]|uniref:hypothetical protein n=1 Tax=Photorhabdus luminescens TaxID=29488 RepID=UPI0022404C4A|nr:hypothetical protein [Photorhabdus luminescens]MCW7762548.1 hypothetical protein [Photorhabdus luminescens subsp. venezuelensis]